ncbi:MAG: hypothetical protein V5A31_12515 [Haloferacaceae archaeon]
MTDGAEDAPVGDRRPTLKEVDHEAPDGASADAVFDRGTAARAARTARERSDARRDERAAEPRAGERHATDDEPEAGR